MKENRKEYVAHVEDDSALILRNPPPGFITAVTPLIGDSCTLDFACRRLPACWGKSEIEAEAASHAKHRRRVDALLAAFQLWPDMPMGTLLLEWPGEADDGNGAYPGRALMWIPGPTYADGSVAQWVRRPLMTTTGVRLMWLPEMGTVVWEDRD